MIETARVLERTTCILVDIYTAQILRGVAQLGRAPALGAGGRRFESCHPDHIGWKKRVRVGSFFVVHSIT